MIALPDLKAALKLDPADTSEDAYIGGLESAAVAHVQRATGRRFGATQAAAEFVVEGSGSSTLYLPEYATAVTAVTERHYLGDTGTVILTGASDGWALRVGPGQTHGARLLRKGGAVWHRDHEYAVTASVGYAAGQEPADIRQAVTMLVTHWFETRNPVGTVGQEVAYTLRDLLAPWKRWTV